MRSKLRGTDGDEGQIWTTSAHGSPDIRDRSSTPHNCVSTTTAYLVPSTKGKRGTKYNADSSRTTWPAIDGNSVPACVAPARTRTSASSATPSTRMQSSSCQRDHERVKEMRTLQRCGLQGTQVLAARVVALQRENMAAVEIGQPHDAAKI